MNDSQMRDSQDLNHESNACSSTEACGMAKRAHIRCVMNAFAEEHVAHSAAHACDLALELGL